MTLPDGLFNMNYFVLIPGGENTPVNKTPFCQQGLARGAPPL